MVDSTTIWPSDWTLPPPTDSDQVKEWLKELDGAQIPNIPVNKKVDGGNGVTCDDNPDAVQNAGADKNCWWTCSGCLRDEDISTCKDTMTWGLTFDDGPVSLWSFHQSNLSINQRTIGPAQQGLYTNKLLTYLESKDLKATFFLVGPRVVSRPEIVVYQHMNGHELG